MTRNPVRIRRAEKRTRALVVLFVATLTLAGCSAIGDQNTTKEDCALAAEFLNNSDPQEGFISGWVAAKYWPLITNYQLSSMIKWVSDADGGELERARWVKAEFSIKSWQSLNCGP